MVIEPDRLLAGRQCAAVQHASVHTSEGGTESLLALTVPIPWQRASIGSRPVHPRDLETWLEVVLHQSPPDVVGIRVECNLYVNH